MGQYSSKLLSDSEEAKDSNGSSDVDQKVLVLGAGNFGCCLADHLATLGNSVLVWARDKQVVDSINNENTNCKYLKGHKLSPNLKATKELSEIVIDSASVIILSIPTQYMRSILVQIEPFITFKHLVIFVNKGIEMSTLQLPSDIANEVLGQARGARCCFLSGPSFAVEVVSRQPTAVTVASRSQKRAHRTQRLFHSPCFRVYDIEDVNGLEIAGALKNVIAIASGAATGAGYQSNARAAVITRGLAEITRFGIALGANPLTFAGLSGVGDLFLTCSSEKSRNFTVGYRIGKGETLEEITSSLGSVAEGVPTTKAAYQLARKFNVDSPITDEVYRVLYENKPVQQAFKDMMERDPSSEFRGIMDKKSYFS